MKKFFILMLLFSSVLSYGMLRRSLFNRPTLSRLPQRRPFSHQSQLKTFHLTPKITLDEYGNKIPYSPQQQLTDLMTGDKNDRWKDMMQNKYSEIMKKAEKEFEEIGQSIAKEVEQEVQFLKTLPDEYVEREIKLLQEEEEKRKTIYISPSDQSKE